MSTAPIPDTLELRELHSRYLRMTGPSPAEPWHQPTYDRLVLGLVHHGDALLPGSQHEPLTTDWMETLSGRRFSPFDEEPDFELRDLVWGVARAQRYAGQFKEEVEHYSVAEHMVLMTRWLMARERHTFDLGMSPDEFREVCRCAATHDLPEGLLLDMVRPIKRHDDFYRQAEARLSGVLAERYGLQFPLPSVVKWLDNRILVDERAQAMNPSSNNWGSIDGQAPMGITLQFWSPRRAAEELFRLLDELGVRD